MQDTFKSFLIALVTSVAVLFVLGPVMMKVHGLDPRAPAAAPEPAATTAGPPAPQTTGAPPAPAAPQMTAPNIEGMSAREARERFRSQGITIIEEGEREDATAKPGTILEQIPSGGAPLESKEVRVVVAKAPELTGVPNVVGKKLEAARDELVEAGFEVPDATFEASDEAAGTVIRQEPNAGAKSDQGAIVRLVVSQELVEVPKLYGQRQKKAREKLEKLGLVVGKTQYREDEEMSGGRVLGSKPGAGEQIAPGTKVDLIVVAPD